MAFFFWTFSFLFTYGIAYWLSLPVLAWLMVIFGFYPSESEVHNWGFLFSLAPFAFGLGFVIGLAGKTFLDFCDGCKVIALALCGRKPEDCDESTD